MTTADVSKFKGSIKDAAFNWASGLIDNLLPRQAAARALLKNAARNVLSRFGSKIDTGVDALFLMLGDEKGNINSDTAVDTICDLLTEMPPTDYAVGPFGATVGAGQICVEFPKGIISEMLAGSLGGVKISAEDIKKIKEYIK